MATKKKAEKSEEERSVGSVVNLTEDEQSTMTNVEEDVVKAKMALADADLIFSNAERARNEARAKLVQANEAYTALVINIAKAHQINTEDKNQKWSFDTAKLTFTRQA